MSRSSYGNTSAAPKTPMMLQHRSSFPMQKLISAGRTLKRRSKWGELVRPQENQSLTTASIPFMSAIPMFTLTNLINLAVIILLIAAPMDV